MNPAARPALGETVHYLALNNRCTAAIVTGHAGRYGNTEWPMLHLRVLHLTETSAELHIHYAPREEGEHRTWHWGCGRT